ncbi:MAG: 16S rRNA (guanine(527)-N(7))-methyltransferase RsmG [Alphaproteobacteria bacterium]
MSAGFGPAEFQARTNVSRETLDRLKAFAALLAEWQARMNLLASGEVGELWWRHMFDSAQLVPVAPENAARWADLGSGAGFPGLVVAVMLSGRPGMHMSLVESNARKAAFLRESVRITGAPASVLNARAEELAPLQAEIVTARALSPLPELLEIFERHCAPGGIGLFLKGKDAARELTQARKAWTFAVDLLPSQTDPGGTILRLSSARRTAGNGHPSG